MEAPRKLAPHEQEEIQRLFKTLASTRAALQQAEEQALRAAHNVQYYSDLLARTYGVEKLTRLSTGEIILGEPEAAPAD